MAIEQESAPDEADLKLMRRSAIENEIPTYRAVSTRAVFSVICGLLAALSFTHPAFYLFAAAAVALGFWADRAIQKHPEMLTGQSLARAGVAMGLVFGLSIYTITTVQWYLSTRQAGAFASEYAKVVKNGSLADIYWLGLAPPTRAHVTPEDNFKSMQGQKEEAAMSEMKFAGIKKLSQDLHSSPANTITFHAIENMGREDLVQVAIAVFDVNLAATPHEHKDGEEHKEGEAEHKPAGPQSLHAMAVIKGIVPDGKSAYEWWVDDVVYPYVPKTAALPDKPVDDGHGHAPGGH
ncbi:hypothetical protein [Paludisphaera mucosa]|uniref:DUF4190 domain-containing protein n=1 Tax=Paludisphaera mucosa TaxID=3030827 RepID=A0ABT6F4G6_9BACT|nr:hypothetical protein [Paludisphaera mucosa]MDG3002461.1 hypothetical protein [Paludisphaera mucosa]